MLAVDVGTVTTRAMLFDVVDGRYRFLAMGTAPSTAQAPYHDIAEGVRQAIDQLQAITGWTLIDDKEQLIIPSSGESYGVDTFAATISAGPALKIVVVGLLEDISLESACRLASTTYAGVVERISLNDRNKPEARLQTILRLRPDMVLITGGTEGGASQSILRLLESVGLACYLMPESQRPEVIYAGNQALKDEVESSLGKIVDIHYAANVRPALEVEQLEAAQAELAEAYCRVRGRTIPGVSMIDQWAGGGLLPTAYGLGRMVRFLSKAYGSNKGVMGVDLGASSTTIATAYDGKLDLAVHSDLGLGGPLPKVLSEVQAEQIARWVPFEVSPETVRDYAYHKSLYPASVPVTEEDLALEQAFARVILQQAVRRSMGRFAVHPGMGASNGLLPPFEPIVAAGSVITRAPNLGSSLLTLLDGLQPTGVTTLVMDQNHIAPVLGAAAAVNPVLAVQVLDSNTFQYLGTVISPSGNARPGTPVLRVKMVYSSGHETNLDIKQGSLEMIPLPMGQSAALHLQALHRMDVGMGGPGRSGRLKVQGGALGVVIDARGRPLRMAEDPARRQELMKKWLWTLGGIK